MKNSKILNDAQTQAILNAIEKIVDGKTLATWEKEKIITISNGNKKQGFIKSFSLPPLFTCNHKAPCYNENKCYFLHMEKLRLTVSKSVLKNLYLLLKYPDLVFNQLFDNVSTQLFFRWFVGGDIISGNFFTNYIIKLAKLCKKTTFLLFTKKYDIINNYLDCGFNIPKNLKIIFSFWKNFRCENKYNLPVNEFLPKNEKPLNTWLACGGNCQKCGLCGGGCWSLKSGDIMYIKEH